MTHQTTTQSIRDNLLDVRQQIADACVRAGRSSDEVTLVAVSKQRPVEELVTALEAGVTHFGENRVEEAASKIQFIQEQNLVQIPTWHMIGHVQSRKARDIAMWFDVVHSLDSQKSATRLDRFANETNRVLQAYIQVNVSGEDSKTGFAAFEWEHRPTQRQTLWDFVASLKGLAGIQTLGLMTMAPYEAEPEATRPVFVSMRRLRDALSNDFPTLMWDHLSMGMTNDYSIAIEEGATVVRVGRAIFGERTY